METDDFKFTANATITDAKEECRVGSLVTEEFESQKENIPSEIVKLENDGLVSLSADGNNGMDEVNDGGAMSTGIRKVEVNCSLPPEDADWHTVGFFTGLKASVDGYIDNNSWSSSGLDITSLNIPDLSGFQRVNLEPNANYKFRLRAINRLGTSDWSEVTSLKTAMPGLPDAPIAIKIAKSSEGVHISWDPPTNSKVINDITDYSVYLAVKPCKDKARSDLLPAANDRSTGNLTFVRVYCGGQNYCIISHKQLSTANIDVTTKPAVVFRVAAKNGKGWGPATQVRWLLEASNPLFPRDSSRPISPVIQKSPDSIGKKPKKKLGRGGDRSLKRSPPKD